jgi:acyl-CoA thioesterase
MDEESAYRLAQAVGEAMYARDHAAQALGITVEEIAPGFARCRMAVREDMLNGHGTCHGGLTFTLADTAFAYACNAGNKATVALAAQISFTAPVRPGEVLVAIARERLRSGRTGVYDVEVSRSDGAPVALFRGNAYETRDQVIADQAGALSRSAATDDR